MKLGIVIYSTDAEVVFNAFRLANFSLKEKDDVRLFLLASGVEYGDLHSDKFPVLDLAKSLLDGGGQILACGTCLNLRDKEGTELCPLSTMKDLYELICDCDKTVSF
ncbi:DsrE family protein [Flavobacteriales bacterium]|nr:DsrE family protein [Flavobacteriales bacterium]MDB2362774.1 DsrE family protein [Flavobacteriales bacterium]